MSTINANINANISYDEAFAQLENVLRELEDGELQLERALALYEQGVALAALCSQKLEDAELRVRKWQGPSAGGEELAGDQTAPFEGWQDK